MDFSNFFSKILVLFKFLIFIPLTLPSSAVAISYSLLLIVTFKANSRATTQVNFCYRNWKPIDPGKFGWRRQCTPERHPPVHPLQVSRCQMSHLLLAQIDTILLVIYATHIKMNRQPSQSGIHWQNNITWPSRRLRWKTGRFAPTFKPT